jgi:hypothetical protein
MPFSGTLTRCPSGFTSRRLFIDVCRETWTLALSVGHLTKGKGWLCARGSWNTCKFLCLFMLLNGSSFCYSDDAAVAAHFIQFLVSEFPCHMPLEMGTHTHAPTPPPPHEHTHSLCLPLSLARTAPCVHKLHARPVESVDPGPRQTIKAPPRLKRKKLLLGDGWCRFNLLN